MTSLAVVPTFPGLDMDSGMGEHPYMLRRVDTVGCRWGRLSPVPGCDPAQSGEGLAGL